MKILIVEDEAVAARGLERMLREILKERIHSLKILKSLTASEIFLEDYSVDLMFLDLNLNGEDGFELLRSAAASSFHTIIVSANTARAIEAFQYGVLDFVPKPVNSTRLKEAVERFNSNSHSNNQLKYLSIKKDDTVQLIPIEEIVYLEGNDNTVFVHLRNGEREEHRKTLQFLEGILPVHFHRIHKSYILDIQYISNFRIRSGSRYEVELKNGTLIPLSRNKYKELKDQII